MVKAKCVKITISNLLSRSLSWLQRQFGLLDLSRRTASVFQYSRDWRGMCVRPREPL